MTSLVVKDLSVTYSTSGGDEIVACQGIDLSVGVGEFVTIIGPSGCGKSTLLHAMGGLLKPSSGSISLDGRRLTDPSPRDAAFVFQDYSLFPWKSVLDNVGAGLKFAGEPARNIAAKARAELEFVGLGQFADRYPRELSGGMQQRVAIARALALEPKFLLMDEPFGALDEQTRRNLGRELGIILGKAERGVVLITHSLEEAIFWADRIIVMSSRPGRIVKEIHVESPRPRDLSFMTTPEFAELRADIFDLLELQHV
jgi:NitT/TauT family transport system ATP-binding protein